MPKFQVVSDYTPSGDQPQAIASLAQGVELGLNEHPFWGDRLRQNLYHGQGH